MEMFLGVENLLRLTMSDRQNRRKNAMSNDNKVVAIAVARPNLSQVAGMSIAELNALSPDHLDELLVQAEIAVNVISIARHAITRRAALKSQP